LLQVLPRAQKYGSFFKSLGLTKNDVVHLLLSPYSLETPLIVIGLWSVNGVVSFGNIASFDSKTITEQLKDVNAKFVLATQEFVSFAEEAVNKFTINKPVVVSLDAEVRPGH